MGNLRQEISLIDNLKRRKKMLEDLASETDGGQPSPVASGQYADQMKKRAAKEAEDKPWYKPWAW